MSPALLTVEEIHHLAESVVDDETRNMGAVYVMLSLMQQWDSRRRGNAKKVLLDDQAA